MRRAPFRARIPYGVGHSISGAKLAPGALRFRRDRHGEISCAIVDAGKRNAPIGRTLSLVEGPDGIAVEVELADDAIDRASSGRYFVEPLTSKGTLVALEVSALESWASAELRPASEAPRAPRSLVPTIPPRPEVNLRPFGHRPGRPRG